MGVIDSVWFLQVVVFKSSPEKHATASISTANGCPDAVEPWNPQKTARPTARRPAPSTSLRPRPGLGGASQADNTLDRIHILDALLGSQLFDLAAQI